jgi:tetratricopeptide (TPR) repeat protein
VLQTIRVAGNRTETERGSSAHTPEANHKFPTANPHYLTVGSPKFCVQGSNPSHAISARALALAPTDAAVFTDAAATEQALGSLGKSIELARRAVALDPVSVDTRFYLAMSYQFTGRLAEAESEARRMIELSSTGIFSHGVLGTLLLMQGRAKDALTEAQLEPEKMYRLQTLAAAHYALGQLRESDAALQTMIQDFKQVGPYPIAWAYTMRGDRDKAFEWLDAPMNSAIRASVGCGPTMSSSPSTPTPAGPPSSASSASQTTS